MNLQFCRRFVAIIFIHIKQIYMHSALRYIWDHNFGPASTDKIYEGSIGKAKKTLGLFGKPVTTSF